MPGVPPHPPVDLKDLARRLSAAPLRDELVLEGLNHYLQGFRGCLDGRDEHLRGCLDAASTMVRFLKHLEEPSAEDVRAMAVRLLSLVHEAASSKRPRGGLDSVQAALPSTTSPAGISTMGDMALGEVMVSLGLIDPRWIEEALRRQAVTGHKFGETLIELGCPPEAVRKGLMAQKAQAGAEDDASGEAGPIHSILLGETLVGMGKINRRQLVNALGYQKNRGIRIGAALVGLGMITWPDVAEALRVQEQYRFATQGD